MNTNIKEEKSLPNSITKIRWPYGKNDTLFSYGDDRIIKDSIFAVTVKGVSYLGDLDDFNVDYLINSEEFFKDVPLGRTTIDLYERRVLFSDGEQLWKNEEVINFENFSAKELEERKLTPYAVKKQDHYAIFLGESSIDQLFCIPLNNVAYNEYFKVHPWNEGEVLKCAQEYSKAHNCPCLVAKRIYSCTWH